MQTYKKILKYILALNILFIMIVAGLGYKSELKKQNIKEVSRHLEAGKESLPKGICDEVIPVGKVVGIYVNTDGILVIDTGEVTDMEGKKQMPARNKLIKGDYIKKLNGETMKTKKQLIQTITECKGKTLLFEVLRNGVTTEVMVEPVETEKDIFKVGIWVRDDLQGLGTITYVDGLHFGALGHSINDADTGSILQISSGEIYEADILGVEKGVNGTPGEIKGMIEYQTENVAGNINKNRIYGIFGDITNEFKKDLETEVLIPVAMQSEVTIGKAYIQSYISGKKELYEIEIVDIHKNENGDKEMQIYVTDDNLIALTGGIVQGMSGSPILQNGKLIGAVTHVFVENPRKGYGMFVETMCDVSQ